MLGLFRRDARPVLTGSSVWASCAEIKSISTLLLSFHPPQQSTSFRSKVKSVDQSSPSTALVRFSNAARFRTKFTVSAGFTSSAMKADAQILVRTVNDIDSGLMSAQEPFCGAMDHLRKSKDQTAWQKEQDSLCLKPSQKEQGSLSLRKSKVHSAAKKA